MAEDRRIIHEITPLMGKDVLYIADRHKKEFTYPIHNHSVFELNFVENAAGVKRIVGDSQEIIGDFDLCLITSPDLEHVWEQNVCRSEDIREITIQFDFSMGEETLFGRNPYASITRMMQEAKKGLCFPLKAIMKVYHLLDTLSTVKDGFYAVQQFLTILYELSKCENARTLASSSYAKVAVEDDSRRLCSHRDCEASREQGQPWRYLRLHNHEHRKADWHCSGKEFSNSNPWYGKKQQS